MNSHSKIGIQSANNQNNAVAIKENMHSFLRFVVCTRRPVARGATNVNLNTNSWSAEP
jgi:hypothetical protein